MLFKIDNLLIEAKSEFDAVGIFKEATGFNHMLPIKVLIGPGEQYTDITSDLMSVETIDSMYANCISCINEKYKDTNGAVQYIMKYITDLSKDQLNGIFKALIKTSYNETLPMLTLLESMRQHNVSIPRKWIKNIRKHISEFWIKLDYNTDIWHINQDNLKLLDYINETSIYQIKEDESQIESLIVYKSSDASLRRLINSVNYSWSTLFEFIDCYPDNNWIMRLYDYKQKAIRDGVIDVYNELK